MLCIPFPEFMCKFILNEVLFALTEYSRTTSQSATRIEQQPGYKDSITHWSTFRSSKLLPESQFIDSVFPVH